MEEKHMETQDRTQPTLAAKQKRIRRRSLAVQLQQALDEAAKAATGDPDELAISRIKLAQTRLVVLSKALNRERHDKLRRAEAEVSRLGLENEKLKQELAAKPAARPLTEVDQVLAKYEASKQNGGAS
jgi:hypothetical protein